MRLGDLGDAVLQFAGAVLTHDVGGFVGGVVVGSQTH